MARVPLQVVIGEPHAGWAPPPSHRGYPSTSARSRDRARVRGTPWGTPRCALFGPPTRCAAVPTPLSAPEVPNTMSRLHLCIVALVALALTPAASAAAATPA